MKENTTMGAINAYVYVLEPSTLEDTYFKDLLGLKNYDEAPSVCEYLF